MKTIIIIFLILLSLSPAWAEIGHTFAYKLAILHIKNINPEKVLLEGKIEPSAAVVYEFQWILDTIKNRCINSEETIASTIVETWNLARQHLKDITLLETARALSLTARNPVLFGDKKVNFRMTSKYWLAQQILK